MSPSKSKKRAKLTLSDFFNEINSKHSRSILTAQPIPINVYEQPSHTSKTNMGILKIST